MKLKLLNKITTIILIIFLQIIKKYFELNLNFETLIHLTQAVLMCNTLKLIFFFFVYTHPDMHMCVCVCTYMKAYCLL